MFEILFGVEGFTGDPEKAHIILEWASSLKPTSHYLHQVRTSTLHEIMPPQVLAFLVSSVQLFEDQASREIADIACERTNEAIGEHGDDLRLDAVLIRIHPASQGDPRTYVCTLRDDKGRTLKWFSNVQPHYDTGARLSLECIVKRHDEFHEAISTVISVTSHALAKNQSPQY